MSRINLCILIFVIYISGYWLWEARSTAIHPQLLGSGMQFVMKVGFDHNLPLVPIDFPSCSNYKGMKFMIEDL